MSTPTPLNPWASIEQGTQVQKDASSGKPFLLIWIHPLRTFAPFEDTREGLRQAQQTLVKVWNRVQAPLHTPVCVVQELETLFCIKRVRPCVSGADEVVSTLQEAFEA